MGSEAGKRILEGVKEALAVAKGEQPAASVHINGFTYVPDGDVRQAIATIKAHLRTEWISDGCREFHAFGCASCQAVFLEQSLDALEGVLDSPPGDTP